MKRKLHRTIEQNIRVISPVWIVPIVALVIAVWLAVQARLEQGAEIKITFASASDIIAGQTKVKLKDVDVGNVTEVRLSKDLTSVVVTVDIDRSVISHLSENTRFWMVTPKISASGVSNLGTLINGVFIQMDPGIKGDWATSFRGLDDPPLIKSDEPGKQYLLQAETLGSIDIGSPIYFRKVQVGEVTGYKLSENNDHVDINFFIKSPFDTLVETQTRFWNVSGVGVSVSADGIEARMASLASLISGGIAFENVSGLTESVEAEKGHRFFLYPDKESVIQQQFSSRFYYLARFSDTVDGLAIGASVDFRGIKIGEVVDIKLTSSDNVENSLDIYFTIEPQRFDNHSMSTRQAADDRIENMIQQGLRAQMKTSSLITGSKYIELGYYADPDENFAIETGENYSIIPSGGGSLDDVTQQLADIMEKVNAIPFDQIGADLAASMGSLKAILNDLNSNDTAGKIENVLASADATLSQIEATMKSFDGMVAPDSELKHELTQMIKSVGDAAASVDRFAEELNRHPNSLIFGNEKDE